jgi:16S rRNA (adenine1518-N6/adenine1519-N6)-dimethyltransferase
MSAMAGTPAQPSIRRLRRFGVRPDRDLGQNFLIDSNILGVIERAAELQREDVVLEIGGGLGVLSEHLAARVQHLHVIELDERLREPLADALAAHANVSVHWGDALRVELGALDPPPVKLVANLPYGIAAQALLRTIEELSLLTRWTVMVQREVGERLAAAPGSSAYGAPSVIAQLACEVRVLRAIPRTVFHPVPNVDSVLLELRRRAPASTPAGPLASAQALALRRLVAGAFAHRRKTLAGSLALAGVVPVDQRDRVRAALERLGHAPDARAERLSPGEFQALVRLLQR